MNYLQKTLLFIILFISAQLVSAQNITVTGEIGRASCRERV